MNLRGGANGPASPRPGLRDDTQRGKPSLTAARAAVTSPALGDAEHEDTMQVNPGMYRVQVRLDHSWWAENVVVWLAPSGG